jgi:microcystin-dependent protein
MVHLALRHLPVTKLKRQSAHGDTTQECPTMAQPFLGQIASFPFNFAPKGWALCQGQLMSISQNTALFSLLGTYYGGNGTSNFALPDLRSRSPIHWGQGPGLSLYDIGEVGGVETVPLLGSENGSHNHTLFATTNVGTTSTATGNQLAKPQEGSPHAGFTSGNIYSTVAPTTNLFQTAITPAGSGQPHNNIQPYQCLSYCIALQGIYPSRN